MNKQNKTPRQREQIGGCQRRVVGEVSETGEGDQDVQIFSHKISHGDMVYSIVTVVSNIVLHIM